MNKNDVYGYINNDFHGNSKVVLFKIADYIEQKYHNISLEEINEIVEKSSKLQNLISDFIKQNQTKISSYGLESFSSNEIFLTLIDSYCDMNNILIYNFDCLDELKNIDSLKLYYQDIKLCPVLSKEETNELFIKYHNGDLKAKEKLITGNLRLVLYFANSFCKKYNRFNQIIDIIQAGNIGLIQAVERFDYNRGSSFSTCAFYWIRKEMFYESNKDRPVYLPKNFLNYLKKYLTYIDNYYFEHSEYPSDENVAANTNISKYTIGLIRQWGNANINVSIDQKLSNDSDLTVVDFITSSEDDRMLEDEIISKQLFDDINQKIKEIDLTEREKDILKRRLVKNDTLEAIGQDYNITRERVRQIEQKTLVKIQRRLTPYKKLYFEK